MNKDIIYLDKVMSLSDKKELLENNFCWLYPFTNENINGYYSEIDFLNKDLLTVTSSGDHILNAILLGAKNICGFDINPLAKYYAELKIAGIKALTLDEFIMFFYAKYRYNSKKMYLNKDIYLKKLRKFLNIEYKDFWDYFFNNYNMKQINKSYLFTDDYLNLKGLLNVNLYLNLTNYYKLKELLKNNNVTYVDMNLSNLKSLNRKFDIIVLSNIPTFLEDIYAKNSLKCLKKLLESLGKEDSKVVVNYFYNNLLYNYDDNIMYDRKKVSNYFNSEDYEYITFESSDSLSLNKTLRILGYREDKILVSKNKKNY